jgi:hypothetical protein
MSKEIEVVDRTGWPEGPWDGEEDRYDFQTGAGLPAIIQRSALGNLCGYVIVPPGHPAYGRTRESLRQVFDAPGGITYAKGPEGSVSYATAPGEPEGYWAIGFDCGHAFDLVPALESLGFLQRFDPFGPMAKLLALHRNRAVYRDVGYVRAHCEMLAAQLAVIQSLTT